MKLFYFFILFSTLTFNCYAEKYIQAIKSNGQKEILVEGATILASEKTTNVWMYQTSEKLKLYGRSLCLANFHFEILNKTDKDINFHFEDLQVTDQLGRQIKVVHKSVLIDNKKLLANMSLCASAFCTGLQSVDAQNAGKIDYSSNSYENYHTNYSTRNNKGWSNASANTSRSTATCGTIHCEALRQQAVRQVNIDGKNRDNQIKAVQKFEEDGLRSYYFDSTTIFSETSYRANFQIEIPKQIEKDIEYLLFTFNIAGEKHTFCYYCWD